MNTTLTFQDAIRRLNEYWASHGCLIMHPANTEVGAGTMNPATYLRVLGPEPWHVAYVEPSMRPDDSRYGENPNRLQMHTQYQVILKPDPGDPQELYLGSLEALGINRRKHDIRFVEDNWESPALHAWGLGWEVWLDGLEITQFTYFQQAGGYTLEPVAVEITYGLERILMSIQGVMHFKDIMYAAGVTYGELFGQNEYEMSVYNLDEANVERILQLFNTYEVEARALLEKRLPIPAYSYVLKTSHMFNLLDARGFIGVTERARYFARMRTLARKVATLWLERREALGFPLGQNPSMETPSLVMVDLKANRSQTVVLEIGSEELPPMDIVAALDQLRDRMPAFLKDLRLDHGAIEVEGTPRRQAVIVYDVAPAQGPLERSVKGPRTQIAYDEAGQPTQAARGFARSQGVDVAALKKTAVDGIEYVVGIVHEQGQSAGKLLAAELPRFLGSLTFTKSMRWNQTGIVYSRPIRWLVALLDDQIIPFSYGGLQSGRISYGLRNAAMPTFEIPRADDYKQRLEQQHILLSFDARKNRLWSLIQQLVAEVDGVVPEQTRDNLLNEIAHLVEYPRPLLGTFEDQFLSLPREVLVTVMRKHQRYFSVDDKFGHILPFFITVANGMIDNKTVRAGNEAVLRARFADAAFFFEQDTAQPLTSFRAPLATITFQHRLGSMLEKNERIEHLVDVLADKVCDNDDEKAIAQRAAYLAKADLATQMVVEFTSLAGSMGREYALRRGERPEVALAIFEHVLPRYADDAVPLSRPGATVSIADRLDSLVGLFAVGLAPKTNDPFGLRRTASGLVHVFVACDIDLDLWYAIHGAGKLQPVPVSPDVEQEVCSFVVRRLEQWLLDRGERHDLVRAVIVARGHRPAFAVRTLQELAPLVDTEHFNNLLTAYSRATRIARNQAVAGPVNPDLFQQTEEQQLWQAYQTARERIHFDISVTSLIDAMEPLVVPIHNFFNNVFVMVEAEEVRSNRLALLQRIAQLPEGIVNFAVIQGF